MKVLWFPGNGALYSNTSKYNGGGWTGALAKEMVLNFKEIHLGIAIPWESYMKDEKDGVFVYGVPIIKHGMIAYQRKLNNQLIIIKRIVEDFQPDIIHVFGSEHTGGLVATVTNIPVVLHLQGILNYIEESLLPQNLSWGKFVFMHPRQWFYHKSLRRACSTEQNILESCKFYMGRTEMDRRVSRIFSPNSRYFYCSEVLRSEIFHSTKRWDYKQKARKKIISVISSPIYKGGDVILRAAKVLKENMRIDFEWNVYGVSQMKSWERLCKIKAESVNVNICGVIDAHMLVDAIIASDVFVHPSYIENSPNTVCEAQLLGIPVIANYVGGISSIIRHTETGILLPANDPYMTASYIAQLCSDHELACRIGRNGRRMALNRHNPSTILRNVINIYDTILNK